MNPYEVLDVSPRMSLREINVRYREQLLLHHPDLHTQEGPEAVQQCERKTKELNEAMAMMRTQHPKEGVRVDTGATAQSFSDFECGVTFAWEQSAAARPMACPLCGNVYQGGVDELEKHILDVHMIDLNKTTKVKRKRGPIMTPRERKTLRSVAIYVGFAIFCVVAVQFGSMDRMSKGQFDPVIPVIVLLWSLILIRLVFKKR